MLSAEQDIEPQNKASWIHGGEGLAEQFISEQYKMLEKATFCEVPSRM